MFVLFDLEKMEAKGDEDELETFEGMASVGGGRTALK